MAEVTTQLTQNIRVTFIKRRPNVFGICPTLSKCYTNVLWLLVSSQSSFAAWIHLKYWIFCDIITHSCKLYYIIILSKKNNTQSAMYSCKLIFAKTLFKNITSCLHQQVHTFTCIHAHKITQFPISNAYKCIAVIIGKTHKILYYNFILYYYIFYKVVRYFIWLLNLSSLGYV